jgi:hypothetical protein
MDPIIAQAGLCLMISIAVLLFQGLYFAAFISVIILYMLMCITGH